MKMLLLMSVVLFVCCLTAATQGSLVVSDTSIINLYQLNEQSSGSLTNNIPGSFVDSAVTGTAQNHDDAAWPAPVWGSGSDFAGIGDGRGLTFSRSAGQLTRALPWMNVSQGNYVNGGSFTIMTRLYASSLVDGASYGLLGTTSNYINIDGVSGNRGKFMTRIREGGGGGETSWYFDSFSGTGGGVSGNSWLSINQATWYNVFLIYDADAGLTIATDDGTTFNWIKTTNVPADFSTLAYGFSDPDRHTIIGNNVGAVTYTGFDGRMESIVMWDKALTNTEADAIGFTTIPEPATMALLGMGLLAIVRRK
ncbi:MAG: PEP-CTERM sorting domain-containing protein [Sedimentisphaerales bacterium]